MAKIIKVMCDYSATGLWVNDASADAENYVSQELAHKLQEWNNKYESHPPAPCKEWEHNIEFINHGLMLAQAVKAELTKSLSESFKVWYYDPHHIIKSYPKVGMSGYERAYVQV